MNASNENIGTAERLTDVKDIINPNNLPEAGFQSYEMFANDAAAQKAVFLAGEVRNPSLNYLKFEDLSEMDRGIINLAESRRQVVAIIENEEYATVTSTSLEFRMAEMDFVKLLGQVDYMVKNDFSAIDIAQIVSEVRQVNGELYGRPKPEITGAALNELWALIDGKVLDSSAQKLRNELLAGSGCAMLPFSVDPELLLPRFENNQALEWAGEYILEANADIDALVSAYWDQAVEEDGESYMCGPDDIVEVFQSVVDMRDPDRTSGVTVRLVEGKTALSWESPEMAILVGSNRAPIKKRDELMQKVLHEFGVHGQRAISGLQTELPVLGTGLYTQTPRPDYLTFEEGLATTVEEVVGDTVPEWDVTKLGHYINISLAELGADFREVFETAWRYRLLAGLESNQPVSDELVAKHKQAAYTACVRIFRGTPCDLAEKTGIAITPLTFNKDLAYLEGRVLAMHHLEELYMNQDTDGLDRLFRGKYDPTIPEQDMLARKVIK